MPGSVRANKDRQNHVRSSKLSLVHAQDHLHEAQNGVSSLLAQMEKAMAALGEFSDSVDAVEGGSAAHAIESEWFKASGYALPTIENDCSHYHNMAEYLTHLGHTPSIGSSTTLPNINENTHFDYPDHHFYDHTDAPDTTPAPTFQLPTALPELARYFDDFKTHRLEQLRQMQTRRQRQMPAGCADSASGQIDSTAVSSDMAELKAKQSPLTATHFNDQPQGRVGSV